MSRHRFDPRAAASAQAPQWAACALAMVQRLYPHKLDHMILHEGDRPRPQDIHPVFSGCYDWHSSVHMHWSLLRLRAFAPGGTWQAAVDAHFDEHFTEAQVATERRYAAEAGRASFERPYGWAWLLKLQCELDRQSRTAAPTAAIVRWRDALQPFADEVAQRLADFIARSHYQVRAGTHANSAFAMLLARDHAVQCGNDALRTAIDTAARRWFGDDRAYSAAYEPGGTDFLSPGLCEALLMQRVLGASFDAWWQAFAPPAGQLAHWLAPAVVSDRLDPQLVHLDGLNLSRAWCLWALAPWLPEATSDAFEAAALSHWNAATPHMTTGDFAATHWLVSFALLSLEA